MRHPRFGLAVALGVCLLIPGSRVHAQAGNLGSDPFSFYYGYYLPHQAAIAAQPTPLDTINAITQQRQFNAVTNRAALYDPISPYAEEDLDPLTPYGAQRGRARGTQTTPGFASNARGSGPGLYFNRTGRYHPALANRVPRGPNRNIAAVRGSRLGGGGGGIPSIPSLPGPR